MRHLSADLYSVIMFVFGIVVVEVWHTGMPVYAFVVALLICMFATPFWERGLC